MKANHVFHQLRPKIEQAFPGVTVDAFPRSSEHSKGEIVVDEALLIAPKRFHEIVRILERDVVMGWNASF